MGQGLAISDKTLSHYVAGLLIQDVRLFGSRVVLDVGMVFNQHQSLGPIELAGH
jgi:hypothetical protein